MPAGSCRRTRSTALWASTNSLQVERGKRAQALNAVAHRALVGGVMLLVGDGRIGAAVSAPDDLQGCPAKVLDQCQPQHVGRRPKLAERQYGDALIGAEELVQAVPIELPVEIGDQLPSQVVDSRQTATGARGEPRQAVAAGAGQLASGRLDLVADQTVVVQQPRARR